MEGSDAIADESKFPLDAMYFLLPWTDTVTEPAVQPLTPATALAKLMGHRHMAQALDVSSNRRDFARLAQLCRTVPARELIRPTGLETTGQTVASIVSDVRSLAESPSPHPLSLRDSLELVLPRSLPSWSQLMRFRG